MKYLTALSTILAVSTAAAFAPASRYAASSTQLYNAPRHDVRSEGAAQEMDPEEMKIQAALAEHQQNAPKLGFPTDVRTLIQYNHGFAVMSTNSKSNEGFPGGSVVGFAPDELGRPLFIFSGMSVSYTHLTLPTTPYV